MVESCDQKTAATSFKRGLDRNSDLSKELMLRPPNDMSELMHTVARYIELEEYIGGSDVAPVAEQGKTAVNEAKKQVNVVSKKEGAGFGGNKGNGKTWDRPPSDGRDHLAIMTYFKEPIFLVAVNDEIKPEDFRNSPVHYAVATGDHTALSRIVSALPRLADPSKIRTESDSLTQERIADKISLALDRRDNPHRETPLHLAVRLNDSVAASTSPEPAPTSPCKTPPVEPVARVHLPPLHRRVNRSPPAPAPSRLVEVATSFASPDLRSAPDERLLHGDVVPF
ncbi:hypothetical protein C3L33_06428, partial [Rhododendron williamsianum]